MPLQLDPHGRQIGANGPRKVALRIEPSGLGEELGKAGAQRLVRMPVRRLCHGALLGTGTAGRLFLAMIAPRLCGYGQAPSVLVTLAGPL